jgi:nitrate reductase delta subunit
MPAMPPKKRRGSSDDAHDKAVARLAAAWLLWYPDDELVARMPDIRAARWPTLPDATRDPVVGLPGLARVDGPHGGAQGVRADVRHAAQGLPYLTYWTHGDTRNRGMAILHFKQAYLDAGFDAGDAELADHLAVVLEFAAIGDRLTGDALLAEHTAAIGLLQSALESMESPYALVLEAVIRDAAGDHPGDRRTDGSRSPPRARRWSRWDSNRSDHR